MFKFLLVVVGFCAVISGANFLYDIHLIYTHNEETPTFEKHAATYHKTKDIYLTMRMDNTIQPFYTWYDLTKDESDEERKIYGYGPLQNASDFRLRVFIVCNQHGREVVTGELCHVLIRLLQMHVQDDVFTQIIGELALADVGFWIVPVANPWARNQVEQNVSMKCQRTNERGVDLNRNYPSFVERQLDGSPEEFQGEAEFSEYETLAVATFLEYSDAHVVFNIHSGGEDILLPFDGRVDVPPYYSEMVAIARTMRERIGCKKCRVSMASALYGAYEDSALGTLVDYAIDTASADIGYTLEIYADDTIDNVPDMDGEVCANFFNPRRGKQLIAVLRRWTYFILGACEEILRSTE